MDREKMTPHEARAAELFTAALRDFTKEGKYNATIVGTNTYGKGVFQSFRLLPELQARS